MGLAEVPQIFARLGERTDVAGLLGGNRTNGAAQAIKDGNGQNGSGNGNGKKGLPPPVGAAILTKGEQEYLRRLAPSRATPPAVITIADLMETASVIARVSPYKSLHGEGDEALGKYRQKLRDLGQEIRALTGDITGYEGSALRKIRRTIKVLERQCAFLHTVIKRMEAFKTNLEVFMEEQNEARGAIAAGMERELKAADDYLIPKAMEKLLEKVALGAVTLGTAGSVAGSVMGVFAAQVLLPAAAVSAVFLGGNWLLGKQKQRMKEAIGRKYNGQLKANAEMCMGNFRMRMGELALDLIEMFRKAYPRDWDRQYEAIGARIKANLAVENGLPETNGQNNYKTDREIADSLIDALMTQKV